MRCLLGAARRIELRMDQLSLVVFIIREVGDFRLVGVVGGVVLDCALGHLAGSAKRLSESPIRLVVVLDGFNHIRGRSVRGTDLSGHVISTVVRFTGYWT